MDHWSWFKTWLNHTWTFQFGCQMVSKWCQFTISLGFNWHPLENLLVMMVLRGKNGVCISNLSVSILSFFWGDFPTEVSWEMGERVTRNHKDHREKPPWMKPRFHFSILFQIQGAIFSFASKLSSNVMVGKVERNTPGGRICLRISGSHHWFRYHHWLVNLTHVTYPTP